MVEIWGLLLVVAFGLERFLEGFSDFFPRKSRKQWMWLLGILLGIFLSAALGIGILRELFLLEDRTALSRFADYFITGVVIGGGTEPIHSLLGILGYKKEELKRRIRGG